MIDIKKVYQVRLAACCSAAETEALLPGQGAVADCSGKVEDVTERDYGSRSNVCRGLAEQVCGRQRIAMFERAPPLLNPQGDEPQESMKKPPKPFIVAHKRRARHVTVAPTSIWSDETGREIRGLLDEKMASEQGSDGTMESAVAISQLSQAPNPTRSTARILEPQTKAKAVGASAILGTELAEHKAAIETPAAAPIENLLSEDCVENAVTAEAPKLPSVSLSVKPSYRERRRALRKALPLGERWKRHLPQHGT